MGPDFSWLHRPETEALISFFNIPKLTWRFASRKERLGMKWKVCLEKRKEYKEESSSFYLLHALYVCIVDAMSHNTVAMRSS